MASQDLIFNILAHDRNAKKTFKEVGDAAENASRKIGKLDGAGSKAGGALGGSLISGLQAALSVGKSGPAVVGALVGAAAAAAQPISALLASAVLAGLGGTAIAGGLALAARNPQVKKAASVLSEELNAGLNNAAEPFVAPLLRGMDLLGNRAKSLMPELRSIFDGFVPTVDKLFVGFDGFIGRILPGLKVGLEASKPILDAIADGLPEIGAALGDAFKILSGDNHRLGQDIVILMGAAAVAIRATAMAVSFLSDQFNDSLERGLQLASFLANVGSVVFGWAPGASAAMKGVGAAASDALAKYRNETQWSINTTASAEQQIVSLKSEIETLEGKKVEVRAAGAPDAAQQVAFLQRQIDGLRDKSVTITTYQRMVTSIAESQASHPRGSAYRWGGITATHARDGLLSKANVFSGGPPLYAFAEPETGQEAFIPRNGDTSRSRGIARTVVDQWLGGPEAVWPGRGGGGGGGSSASMDRLTAAVMAMANRPAVANVNVSAGSSPLEQLLLSVMRQAIADRGGNVQNVIGTNS